MLPRTIWRYHAIHVFHCSKFSLHLYSTSKPVLVSRESTTPAPCHASKYIHPPSYFLQDLVANSQVCSQKESRYKFSVSVVPLRFCSRLPPDSKVNDLDIPIPTLVPDDWYARQMPVFRKYTNVNCKRGAVPYPSTRAFDERLHKNIFK